MVAFSVEVGFFEDPCAHNGHLLEIGITSVMAQMQKKRSTVLIGSIAPLAEPRPS
jgi:hypothetical protein